MCIDALHRLSTARLGEIIIVDDGSREPVSVRSHRQTQCPVVIVRNPRSRGAAFSRNLGAEVARGTVLGFLDDDASIRPGWFQTVEAELTRDRGAITGPVYGTDSTVLARARQMRYDSRYQELANGAAVVFLSGGNSAIWKDRFSEAGGFPNVKSMSDNGLAERLQRGGYSCHFARNLAINHRNSKGWPAAISAACHAGWSQAVHGIQCSTNKKSRRVGGDYHAVMTNEVLNVFFRLGQGAGRCRQWLRERT